MRLVSADGLRRWMSVEGAESDEDQHEIMFYSLRHAATVTLKEMHRFGAQVLHFEAVVPIRPSVRLLRFWINTPCALTPGH